MSIGWYCVWAGCKVDDFSELECIFAISHDLNVILKNLYQLFYSYCLILLVLFWTSALQQDIILGFSCDWDIYNIQKLYTNGMLIFFTVNNFKKMIICHTKLVINFLRAKVFYCVEAHCYKFLLASFWSIVLFRFGNAIHNCSKKYSLA